MHLGSRKFLEDGVHTETFPGYYRRQNVLYSG